ncbi:MAG: hypothetical protein PHZ26_04810 [Candidatus Gracilibacteria bacterium]|nr:hypothetical protein [Candidatus Gracilibacteria bacterium]MDD2909049.1 hypothetical protein [Candidatus Gracilibacteria bacterium]
MESEFENGEIQNNPEQYKEIEKDFINKVKKYLHYRNEGNLLNILNLTNCLNTGNFNQLMTYFERQKNITKNPTTKQDLGSLYSKILNQRSSAFCESREKAYSTNLDVEDAGMMNSGKTLSFHLKGKFARTEKDTRIQPLQSKQVERIGQGNMYLITLDFGPQNIYKFQVQSSGNSLIVADEAGRLINCNVEKIGGKLIQEDIGLGLSRKYIEKNYRVTIGKIFFTLRFND